MNRLWNLARVTTATTGTGTITLGAAVPSFLTFAQAGALSGDVVTYGIEDGLNSEVGQGTYTAAGTTLTRDVVYRSTGAANTGKITLSGTAEVYITIAAEDIDEPSRTNGIRNNLMQGTVAGTPGTLPTNWIQNINAGVTRQIIGIGQSVGMDYIDVRISGTVSSTGNQVIWNPFFEANNQIAALTGQTWTNSAFIAIVGGTTTNITSCSFGWNENTSAGGFVAGHGGTNVVASLTATLTRFSTTAANSGGGTVAMVNPYIFIQGPGGSTVDFTLRIAWPQMELGAFATTPIRTTTVAVTRLSDVVRRTSPSTYPQTRLLSDLTTSLSDVSGSSGTGNLVLSTSPTIFGAATITATPNTPVLLGSASLANATARGLAVSGNYAYCSSNGTVQAFEIFDTTILTAPVKIGGIDLPGAPFAHVVVAGQIAYVCCNFSGGPLQIIDVSNPKAPAIVGSITAAITGAALAVSGKYLLFGQGGVSPIIRMYDISVPSIGMASISSATMTGASGIRDIVFQGKYAYVTAAQAVGGTGGFYIVDVSDPTNITLIATYNAAGTVSGLVVDGKYAYMAGTPAGNGLEVVDVSDPTTPVRVGSLFTTTQPTVQTGGSLVKAGNYLYYPGITSLIQIIDVTNPAAPVSVTTVSSGTNAQGMAIDGRYLYATANGQIRIYDLLSAQFSSLSSGSIDVDHLYVDRKAYFNDEIQSQRGLIVGQAGIMSRGPITGSSITATGITAGSVVFAGTGGLLSQDNANFFYDSTSATAGKLGIGTAAPTSRLHVAGTWNSAAYGTFTNIAGTLSSVAGTQQALLVNTTFTTLGASLTTAQGILSDVSISSTTLTIGNLVGIRSQITLTAGFGGTVTNAYGYYADPQNVLGGSFTNFTQYMGAGVTNGNALAAGTVTNYQFRANGITSGAAGGTVNNYNYYANVPSGTAPASGTVNNRGIYITGSGGAAPGGTGVVNNFALFSDSTAPMQIGGLFQFLGSTSAFPALKRSATTIQVRLADDSADTSLNVLSLTATGSTTAITISNNNGAIFGPDGASGAAITMKTLAGNFSTSAALGDTVIRTTAATSLILQAGTGAAGLILNGSMIGIGGITAAFPALKRSGTILQVRLADDSALGGLTAGASMFSTTNISSATNAPLVIDNPSVGQQSSIIFSENGVAKWQMGRQTDNGWFHYDAVNALTVLAVSTTGTVFLGESNQIQIPKTGIVGFAGVTSAFPALKRNATVLEHRLANDSAYGPMAASMGTFYGTTAAQAVTISTNANYGRIGTVTGSAGLVFAPIDNGSNTVLRLLTNTAGIGMEAVDTTGIASYKDINIGGDQVEFSVNGSSAGRFVPGGFLQVGPAPVGNAGLQTIVRTSDGNGLIIARDVATPMELWFGVNQASLYTEIQGARGGVGVNLPLLLNCQGGNVGVGSSAPYNKLTVTDISHQTNDANAGAGTLSLSSGTGAQLDDSLLFGVHTGDYSWIQAIKPGTAARDLSLQPNGGNLGIRTATPQAMLHVGETAGDLRVYNTFTSATNGEWFEIDWLSNVVVIGTNKGSGGGVARDVSLEYGGTEQIRLAAAGTTITGPLGIGLAPVAMLDMRTAQSAAAWGINALGFRQRPLTWTDTTSSGTVADVMINSILTQTLAATNVTTFTRATTLYVTAPATGTNVTITNPIAILCGGDIEIDGVAKFAGNTSAFPALKRSTTELQHRLADDSAYGPAAASALAQVGSELGNRMTIQSLTELRTIAAAATTTTTIQIPLRTLVLGVTVRVVTVIPTAATFTVGVTGAATRYGTGIAVAANTTFYSPPTDNVIYYAAATGILITPNLTPATATGQVRITIHYITFTPPTS